MNNEDKDTIIRALTDRVKTLEEREKAGVIADATARIKAATRVPIGVAVSGASKGDVVYVELNGCGNCTFPTDGSAKGRGVYEHNGVLYPVPDPGPDHEICSEAEAKRDPRAQYQIWVPSGSKWDGCWDTIEYCVFDPSRIYALRRPKAKWVACTRAEAHAFGGEVRRPDGSWVPFDKPIPNDAPYRVDATRTDELSPVVIASVDVFRKMAPFKGMPISGGRYVVERATIPVGTYLG